MAAVASTPFEQTTLHLKTKVYFVVDESGSMYIYTSNVRESITSIIDSQLFSMTDFTIITFSDTVEHGNNFLKFSPPQHAGTNIFGAFSEMQQLIQNEKEPFARHVIIFISDGADTNPKECLENLKTLPILTTPCIMVAIGVNQLFPTTIVLDYLRPLYHNGPLTVTPVLPVEESKDLVWAFSQLQSILMEECWDLMPSEVTHESSNKDLKLFMNGKYNQCVVTCAMADRTNKENYDLIFATKVDIVNAGAIAKIRMQTEKVELKIKPLASNLIQSDFYSTKTCIMLSIKITEKLNKMLEDVQKGQLISDLSDNAKREMLGHACVQGRFIHKAMKYHAAKFGVTQDSLFRLLTNYTPNEADTQLQDVINMTSQAEYFQDAQNCLKEIIPNTHTLYGITKYVSFVCRTITLKEPRPSSALQMNIWLAEVIDLPQIHRLMTTYDFIETFQENFESHGEKINSLLVLGNNSKSPGIYHHLQTLFLLENPYIFNFSARLATAASVLTFILGSHSKYEQWMDKELELVTGICNIYTRENLTSWYLYMDDIDDAQPYIFKRCLITESPKFPIHCKCPGLSKFALALFMLISNGSKFTEADLRIRHFAMIVELFARSDAKVLDHINITQPDISSEKFCDSIWMQPSNEHSEKSDAFSNGGIILSESIHLREAEHRFNSLVELELAQLTMSDLISKIDINSEKINNIKNYQFNVERINNIFHHLARMTGHDITFTLSDMELIKAIYISQKYSANFDRCQAIYDFTITPQEAIEINSLILNHFLNSFKQSVLSLVHDFVTTKYTDFIRKVHQGPARVIPEEHMILYKSETGLNIKNDWQVNSSGLSNLACCYPNCPHYLHTFSSDLWEESRTTEPVLGKSHILKPTLIPALREHLFAPQSMIPAFHKCLKMYDKLPVDEIYNVILSGACLNPPFPSNNEKKLSSVKGATNQDQILINMKIESLTMQRYNKQQETLKKIILSYPDLKTQIAAAKQNMESPSSWDYEDFKQTFTTLYARNDKWVIENLDFRMKV